MKKTLFITIFGLMIFLLPALAFGESSDVIFSWNANIESDLAGYRLYQSTISGQYTFGSGNEIADIPAGTETVTIANISDGEYFWVLTAYDTSGNESMPSNEVTAVLEPEPDTTPPVKPTGLTIDNITRHNGDGP